MERVNAMDISREEENVLLFGWAFVVGIFLSPFITYLLTG